MKRLFLLAAYLLLLCTCKKDDDAYSVGNADGPKLSDIIRITSLSTVTPEADTVSTSVIGLHINAESASSNRTITMSTTLGNFLNGNKTMTVTADAAGNAQAVVRSPLAGDAQITATVKSISIDTVIHFKPALPDDMLLTADNYNSDTSTSFNLTAAISRNPGRGLPSDPQKIWFTITPGAGSGGLVYPAFANTAGHTTTIAVTNPFKVSGTFKIEAKTLNDKADTIRKNLTIVIK
ncbi:hypothetical protein SAMN05192574_104240 [Mucilaginibacter gossypiicola]|uniref:Big-1 domain-containing protein n=1 Tax=Mucilaginibacter gossypiicola TaxID=551995 RepID=A0A1H8JLV9_9SPHI|nr:hypothetical protein [Mucilaginibacter gossypiicola]SEN81662.1 hypothetical protein SAMN05192574_104240 [Mucilaginibacter gossypiicola]